MLDVISLASHLDAAGPRPRSSRHWATTRLPTSFHALAFAVVVCSPTLARATTPWALDRIDQPDLPLDGAPFLLAPSTTSLAPSRADPRSCPGAGVHIFLLDAPVDEHHSQFAGRVHPTHDARAPIHRTRPTASAVAPAPASASAPDPRTSTESLDAVAERRRKASCLAHGTAVASAAAASDLGVARCAELHPVRIFDCDGRGTVTDLLRGISHVSVAVRRPEMRPAVVVVSVGGGRDAAVDAAVDDLAKDAFVVVAAGNQRGDACARSPAAAEGAFTVSATDEVDVRSPFANWGRCVDAFAPGARVRVAAPDGWNDERPGNPGNPGDGMTVPGDPGDGTRLAHGTSIAAPLAGGLGAVFLSWAPNATAEETRRAIFAAGAAGRVRDAGDEGEGNRVLGTEGLARAAEEIHARGIERATTRVSCAWFWGGRGAAFGGRAEALEGCF